MQELILPYIWRQVDQILKEAEKAMIPVALTHDSPYFYSDMHLSFPDTPAEPVFCFSKTKNHTRYILQVMQDDQPVSLQDKNTFIITSDPCWLCSGKRLLHFPNGFDGKKLQPFLTQKELVIPASAEQEYFRKFILKVAKTGIIKAEGFAVNDLKPEKKTILFPEQDWQMKAVLVVHFKYGNHLILAGKKQQVFTGLESNENGISVNRTERDFEWETSKIDYLLGIGLQKINDSSLKVENSMLEGKLSIYELIEWINQNNKYLEGEGIEIDMKRMAIPYFRGRISSEIHMEQGIDWFDVTAAAYFSDLTVPLRELKRYLLNGIREFPLPGGEIAILPAEWFTRFKDLIWYSTVSGEKLRLNIRYFSLVRELDFAGSTEALSNLEKLSAGISGDDIVPDSLQATLRPYQEEGFRWLRFLGKNRFGGCLADDMGLGKTIQALTMLLTAEGSNQPASLIVMPASLIHNWQNEIKRFAPSLRVLQHIGPLRTTSTGFFDSVDVILTSYGIMRSNIRMLSSYRFHYVILDESQFIKNPEAQTTRAAFALQSEHRLVLTGTPIENSLSDLWSQMEFLNPGMLGPLPEFRKRFLERGNNILKEDDQEQADRLIRMVKPFILRRTKQEVEKDLPPLVVEDWYCEMSEEQGKKYEMEKSAVRNEILQQLETGTSSANAIAILRALTRLRQIANHPFLVDPEYKETSGKFEEVIRNLEILREEGHKVLIFSSFVKHLQLFSCWFNDQGIPFSMLTGASVHREQIINNFRNDNRSQFFLISLKAGGTGLNLTEASYIMLLDPWWNPATELQAINRAHRIGQEHKVIAYKFISKDTIEEKILKLQQRKQQLSDKFITSGNPLKDLSSKEISELFR